MTRVNAGINPKLLHRRHLVAELREIIMVPASLRRSLLSRSTQEVIERIPKRFTLNTGHVLFFYNKLTFLIIRFNKLCDEMEHRGYIADRTRVRAFANCPEIFYNHWEPTQDDNDIVWQRINERINQKPHLYK